MNAKPKSNQILKTTEVGDTFNNGQKIQKVIIY